MVTAYKNVQVVLSKEALMEKHANRTGVAEGVPEQSSKGRRSTPIGSSGNNQSQIYAYMSYDMYRSSKLFNIIKHQVLKLGVVNY